MDISEHRKNASELSQGSSSDDIISSILTFFNKLGLDKQSNIIDIGCGQGDLLKKLSTLGYSNLDGCDYTDFDQSSVHSFFQHDCNFEFPQSRKGYDIIFCSEVIEHIENPWAFIRNIKAISKPGTTLLLSTPNPESWLSIITLIFKGYFNAFGPRDYPAHITAVSTYELCNMFSQINVSNVDINFIPNGRVPGTAMKWRTLVPFLTGKRFSDNYFVYVTF